MTTEKLNIKNRKLDQIHETKWTFRNEFIQQNRNVFFIRLCCFYCSLIYYLVII